MSCRWADSILGSAELESWRSKVVHPGTTGSEGAHIGVIMPNSSLRSSVNVYIPEEICTTSATLKTDLNPILNEHVA
jgi:hypothetical protein